ncbi:myosin-13-like isoform X1 [Mytilus trossulus]|uniref:myosin-13-like isoform X1 n=1 Tax=Mytilus trossulus TaxID=6551 RepID=UPI003004309B
MDSKEHQQTKISDYFVNLQDAKKLLEEHTTKKILDTPNENELSNLSEQLMELQMIKPELKVNCTSEEKKLLFYQYLIQDQDTWPTEQQEQEIVKQYKETAQKCSEIKGKIMEERLQIDELLEVAEGGHNLLLKNIEDLENKISEVEEKLTQAEQIKNQYEDRMKAFGGTCSVEGTIEEVKIKKREQIDKLDKEIQNGRKTQEAMIKQIQNYRDLVQTVSRRMKNEKEGKLKMQKEHQVKNFLAKEELANLRKLLHEMQRLGGIEECPANNNQIKIKFVNTSQTEATLYLTMTLRQDEYGHVKLSYADVNIETLHCTDLIEEAVRTNDVRSLITQLRERWNMYYPIMTEIDQVSESHAVDWIQDEGLVRVLVGKGGTIMFTLKMPPGYPFKGEITITNTSGLPANVYVKDCKPPSDIQTLQEWVDFLESKFGKP